MYGIQGPILRGREHSLKDPYEEPGGWATVVTLGAFFSWFDSIKEPIPERNVPFILERLMKVIESRTMTYSEAITAKYGPKLLPCGLFSVLAR